MRFRSLPTTRRRGAAAVRTRRPRLEGLEDRQLLAVTPSVTITNPAAPLNSISSIVVGNDGSFQVFYNGQINGVSFLDSGQFFSPFSAPADAGLFIRHADGTVD